MTIARNKIINEEEVGVYLITNRCVRRAFLMGRDLQSGKMLDSRRGWIEDWLEFRKDGEGDRNGGIGWKHEDARRIVRGTWE